MAENVIIIEGLRKEFFELVAVDNIHLTVPSGEIFGLIGPNGAGKTTTLRMLATTLEPTSGRALLDGRDVWKDPVGTRAKIGFMPDFFQLYNTLTTRELLSYFGIAHGLAGAALRIRVDQILHLIDLEDKRNAAVRGLSRGMVQRLGLGRAILHKPKVLLLDEPASGLDPLARKTLFDTLLSIRAEGTTILISSHILAELSDICTSIGIMHDGRFLETGRTDEIIKKIIPRRRIRLTVAGNPQKAVEQLKTRSNVFDARVQDGQIYFDFEGSDGDLAAVNAALLRAGEAVALLEEVQTDLQEIYFAIAKRKENTEDASTA